MMYDYDPKPPFYMIFYKGLVLIVFFIYDITSNL